MTKSKDQNCKICKDIFNLSRKQIKQKFKELTFIEDLTNKRVSKQQLKRHIMFFLNVFPKVHPFKYPPDEFGIRVIPEEIKFTIMDDIHKLLAKKYKDPYHLATYHDCFHISLQINCGGLGERSLRVKSIH